MSTLSQNDGSVDSHRETNTSTVDAERKAIGDRIHNVFDTTGKILDGTARIGATSAGHVGSITGHVVGGVKNIIVKGWRAYNSHNRNSSKHTAV